MRRPALPALLLAALVFSAVAGAGEPAHKVSPEVEGVLRGAKSAILYSLDPTERNWDRRWEKFEGFRILGEAHLDAIRTAAATAAFRSAMRELPRVVPECFNPRHGLRIESGGHEYDFVLCYECGQLYVYRGGDQIEYLGAAGSPDALNAILKAARIRLPPPAR